MSLAKADRRRFIAEGDLQFVGRLVVPLAGLARANLVQDVVRFHRTVEQLRAASGAETEVVARPIEPTRLRSRDQRYAREVRLPVALEERRRLANLALPAILTL